MSGKAWAKPRSRDINQRLAMLGAECTYKLLLTPWRKSSVADASANNAPPTFDKYLSPAVLSRTP
jgi:hypothetical protein